LNCQTLLKDRKVQIVEINGDSLLQLSIEDGRILLRAVLDGEIANSLIHVYTTRDSVNKSTIGLLEDKITILQDKNSNQVLIINNLENIKNNKDGEILILNDTILTQKKDIRKQKLIKKIALIGTVVLPVATLLLILGLK